MAAALALHTSASLSKILEKYSIKKAQGQQR
jgi:hypothetical protein